MRHKRRFWIRFHFQECPVCGRGCEYRERVYGKRKPKQMKLRYEYRQVYDHCVGV